MESWGIILIMRSIVSLYSGWDVTSSLNPGESLQYTSRICFRI